MAEVNAEQSPADFVSQNEGWQPKPEYLQLEDFPEIRRYISGRRWISALPLIGLFQSIMISTYLPVFTIIPFGLVGASVALFSYYSGKISRISKALGSAPKNEKTNAEDYLIARKDYVISADELLRQAEEAVLSQNLFVRRTNITTAAYYKWNRNGPTAIVEFSTKANGSGSHIDLLALHKGIPHAEGLLSRLDGLR